MNLNLAACLGVLLIGAPAHAAITSDQYAALHAGETRWQVQHTIGDNGCTGAVAMHAGQIYLRKLYKADTGSLWVVVDYIKADDVSPFRLVNKSITPDLQLLGERCAS